MALWVVWPETEPGAKSVHDAVSGAAAVADRHGERIEDETGVYMGREARYVVASVGEPSTVVAAGIVQVVPAEAP